MPLNKQELIDSQIAIVKEPILIDDVIGGDGTEVYVEFKGRSSRFLINDKLGNSINEWIDNLPVVTVLQIQSIMNKHNISLRSLSELLDDDILIEINSIDKWVEKYNNHDNFLPINVIDKIVEVNS